MKGLIVGCGLTGAVIAREPAERGRQVEIWERRDHIGGNMYDYVDEHGFLVQKYGPHAFHTTKRELYDYICRFEQWQAYRLTCGAVWDGKYTPTPFNFATIDTFYPLQHSLNLFFIYLRPLKFSFQRHPKGRAGEYPPRGDIKSGVERITQHRLTELRSKRNTKPRECPIRGFYIEVLSRFQFREPR